MSKTTSNNGRLGNQIFRNLAVSIIAEKHNLCVDYSSYRLIDNLGIKLFIGKNNYKCNEPLILTDDNYFSILGLESLTQNLNPNNNYFQSREISNMLYNYLNKDEIKHNIMDINPYGSRYNKNNDLFIHIRLTDVSKFNPGINYYIKTIQNIQKIKNINTIYISSDDTNHSIISQIMKLYPNSIIVKYDEIKTLQFGSTCKNIILSHGTFSAIIGYIAYYSNVYYPEYEKDKIWFGDIFNIDGWNMIPH